MPTESIDIPVFNKNYLDEKIAKLNRKAVQLGCPALVLTYDNYYNKERWEDPHSGRRLQFPIITEMVTATLEYEIPTLDGWEFIAKLDLYTGENGSTVLISKHPEKEVPAEYQNLTAIHCDHCGHKRFRKHSVLIRHTETGEYKQVGSGCVKDFFGGNDPNGFLWMASIEFTTIVGGIKEDEGFGRESNGTWGYDFQSFFTVTAAVIRTFGWTSTSKARAYEWSIKPTVSRVTDNLNPPLQFPAEDRVYIEEEDKAMAEATMEYWGSVDSGNNDYLINCVNILKLGWIPGKYTATAASMVFSYQRAMEKKEEQESEEKKAAALPESQHVGSIGERLKGIEAEVIFERNIETDFGISTLYVFRDTNGNIYKTFYTGASWSAEKGDEVLLTGTVKNHEDYRGKKQTYLSRVIVKVTKEVVVED